MSQKLRQDQILHILEKQGYVTVRYLVERLHYSSATINRDLNAMEALRLVKRSYGGVEIAKRGNLPALQERQFYMKKEKRRVAKAAAALIQNGDTVFLDGSTTVQYILPFLSEKKNLHVITNNMRLAIELGGYDMEVTCLGGRIAERPHVLAGEETVENAQHYRANKMFFSVDSVTLDGEIHSTYYLLYKTMLQNSDEAYFLTDKTKITQQMDKILCDFSKLSGVISDFEFPEATKSRYPNTKFIVAEE
ncbi:MAG: DeoR/GlpR transcriptional regulator [Oscillospiraceae bacterium]|nr:DeoR/GlpR transcriptional regulator [Oscillospiraceae bacterium]